MKIFVDHYEDFKCICQKIFWIIVALGKLDSSLWFQRLNWWWQITLVQGLHRNDDKIASKVEYINVEIKFEKFRWIIIWIKASNKYIMKISLLCWHNLSTVLTDYRLKFVYKIL